jgi:hypothetical protein
MKNIHRPRPHSATADQIGQASPVTGLMSARRPSVQLISDAVVAAYIYEISERVAMRRMSAIGPTRSRFTCP